MVMLFKPSNLWKQESVVDQCLYVSCSAFCTLYFYLVVSSSTFTWILMSSPVIGWCLEEIIIGIILVNLQKMETTMMSTIIVHLIYHHFRPTLGIFMLEELSCAMESICYRFFNCNFMTMRFEIIESMLCCELHQIGRAHV